MKVYWIACRIWGLTIFFNFLLIILVGLFSFEILGMFVEMAGFFITTIISFPLILPIAALINLADRIPHSAGVKMWWLGGMLGLLNFTSLQFMRWAMGGPFIPNDIVGYLVVSFISMMAVIYYSRQVLRKYYLPQTTSNKLS